MMLRERYPIAPYIHMWKIFSGADPFERGVAGWTQEKIDALVFDAINLLQQMDKRTFRSFACRVNLSARERLIAEGYEVSDPVTLCTEMCMGAFLTWQYDKEQIEFSYLFFDRGEKFVGDFRNRWLKERTPPGRLTRNVQAAWWDMIADIQEVDMQRNPPIQAADILAWGHTRSMSERVGNKIEEVMRQVIPSSIAIITEEQMREKSKKPVAREG